MKKDIPNIFLVVHQVADLDAAAKGYTKMLETPGRRIPHGGGRHYFDCGASILSLNEVPKPRASAADLYLTVADVDAAHKRARKLGWLSPEIVHGEPAGEVVVRPWGERSFYALDPWKNGICFIERGTEFTGKR
jgi:hypothetical protein